MYARLKYADRQLYIQVITTATTKSYLTNSLHTKIINARGKLRMDVCMFFFHAKTTNRIGHWMKFGIKIAYSRFLRREFIKWSTSVKDPSETNPERNVRLLLTKITLVVSFHCLYAPASQELMLPRRQFIACIQWDSYRTQRGRSRWQKLVLFNNIRQPSQFIDLATFRKTQTHIAPNRRTKQVELSHQFIYWNMFVHPSVRFVRIRRPSCAVGVWLTEAECSRNIGL